MAGSQSVQLGDRNREIWLARVAGVAVVDIAAEHGMGVDNVWRICRQVASSLPPEDRSELRAQAVELYDVQLRDLVPIMLGAPKQACAPNGKPLVDSDGNKIWDYSEKLQAHDRVLKLQQQRAKLLGLDEPESFEVTAAARLGRTAAWILGEGPWPDAGGRPQVLEGGAA